MTRRSRAHDAEPALAWNVVASRRVDDEHPVVDEFEREGRGEIVAARFDQHDLELRKAFDEAFDGLDIEGRVLADGRVRAGAGLDRQHAPGIDQSRTPDALRVLLGDDVVGDDPDLDVRGP